MKRNGKTQEAESVFNAALDIDPESFFPNYNMGVLKAHMKEYQTAFEYFSRSLEISRIQNEQVYELNVLVNLSMISERLENYPAALKFNSDALRYDPENQKLKTRQTLLKNKASK
jgi:tetratricopeptide (TPR) repeat protein